MRALVAILLACYTALMCLDTVTTAHDRQVAQMTQAPNDISVRFAIPQAPGLSDPTVVLDALTSVAQSDGGNIFRSAQGYTDATKPLLNQYAYLVGATTLFDAFSLKSGTFPTAEQLNTNTGFASSEETSKPDQTGVISVIGNSTIVAIKGLSAAFDALPAAGQYRVECVATGCAQSIVADIAKKLSDLSNSPVSEQDLTISTDSFGGSSDSGGLSEKMITAALSFLLLTAIIALVYRQLSANKRVGVLRMHGMSTMRIWYLVSGRFVLSTLGTVGVLGVIGVALVPGVNGSLVWAAAQRLFIALAICLLVSSATALILGGENIAEAIKNRRKTGALLTITLVAKAVVAVFLLFSLVSVIAQLQNITAKQQQLANWQSTSQYGIFYPTVVGNDLDAIATGTDTTAVAESEILYPPLDKQGSLYIDALDYEPEALKQPLVPGTYRSIVVNPNYLKQYPVRDADGKPVTVSDDESDWILLVPEKFKDQEQDILTWARVNRKSAAEAEAAITGKNLPDSVKNQNVRIVWTQDNQSIFAFNPLINPDGNGSITDPIIEVMTESNSTGIDRANAFTGGPGTALKVKLIDGDTQKTLAALEPILKETKLDDNLTHLVTMNDYMLAEIAQLNRTAQTLTLVAAALLAVLILILIQSMSLVFAHFSRRVIVRRIHGFSLPRRYREYFVLFILSAVVVSACVIIPSAFMKVSIDTDAAPVNLGFVGIVVALFVCFDAVLSGFILSVLERRRAVDVLKKEF